MITTTFITLIVLLASASIVCGQITLTASPAATVITNMGLLTDPYTSPDTVFEMTQSTMLSTSTVYNPATISFAALLTGGSTLTVTATGYATTKRATSIAVDLSSCTPTTGGTDNDWTVYTACPLAASVSSLADAVFTFDITVPPAITAYFSQSSVVFTQTQYCWNLGSGACITSPCAYNTTYDFCYDTNCALPLIESHRFIDPAFLYVNFTGNGYLHMSISLPQTSPARYSPTYMIAGLGTPVALDIFQCKFGIEADYLVSALLTGATWTYTTVGDYFLVNFPVTVSWTETTILQKKSGIPRVISSELSFTLKIMRNLQVNSTITVQSLPNVIWAYVSKSVMAPPAANPIITLTLETGVVVEGMSIDTTPGVMQITGTTGNIDYATSTISYVSSSTVVHGAETDQEWTIIVHMSSDVCQTFDADTISLGFNIIDPGNPGFSSPTVMLISLTSDNWCTVTQESTISGTQVTYLDPAFTTPNTQYYIGTTVYVMVSVTQDEGLDITGVTVEEVDLYGMVASTLTPIFTAPSTYQVPSINAAVLANCPSPAPADSTACFTFDLNGFTTGSTVYIYTTVQVTYGDGLGKKRSVMMEASVPTSSKMKVLRNKLSDLYTPKEEQEAVKEVVVTKYPIALFALVAAACFTLPFSIILLMRRRN